MITEKDIRFLKDVLSLQNNEVDFSLLIKFLLVLKDDKKLGKLVNFSPINKQFDLKIKLLELVNNLNLLKKDINFSLLLKFLSIIKDDKKLRKDLLDSVSKNQFTSKIKLIELINSLNILNKESEIIIFGGWYGSIFIPKLSPLVKKITIIDKNEKVLGLSKNRLFNDYTNIDYIVDDIFAWSKKSNRILKTNLIINTSCEHMLPMKNLINDYGNIKCYFAFQSNNMFTIKTHINCVNDINEFKRQLPENSKILIENEMVEERGKIFMLLGKL